jgi:CDP-glycerol glycerophosphotransferase (TagB/SpsB family)
MIFSLESAAGVILRPLLFIIYFLSGLTPRNPHRWVFGSWSGKRYADNAAALFEYVAAQEDGAVEPIWISNDSKIVHRLRERGYTAYRAWSPQGIYICLTAGVYIFDGLTKDINHWLSRGAKKILLRHGIGIKKVERAIEHPGHRLFKLFHGSPLQKLTWSFLLPWHLVRPDLMIAASPDHERQGRLYYDVGADRVVITGFPRNDHLLQTKKPEVHGPERPILDRLLKRGLPLFLYLPTFRDVATGFDFPLDEMNRMAERLDIILLVKLHFVDGLRHNSFSSATNNNLILIDAAIDANSLFDAVDGLISDYSSVIFDFILTEKPVIFFVPDLSDYLRHSRSFYYDFDDVTPGPKPKNVNELGAAIRLAIDNGASEWQDKYQAVLDRFHTYRDAHSSERTYREIATRFLPIMNNIDTTGQKVKK